MIRTLLSSVILVVLFTNSLMVSSQVTFLDTVTFDTPTSKIIIEATPENIWQIGTPGKAFFNQAFSAPYAIVTDTLNSYPTGNTSTFIYIIRNALTQDCYTSMQFWHKYDTDTLNDFGTIEASYDGGTSWIPVTDTFTGGAMFWWDWDYFQATNEYSQHENKISGNSDGWVMSTFNWQWYFGVFRDTIIPNPDSLMVKFTFHSDDAGENKEGWMIDQIFTSSGYWGGCGAASDIDYERNIMVFPNPFRYAASVQFQKPVDNAVISIYDSFGQAVSRERNISGSEIKLYRNNLKPGLYFLHISENGILVGAKRIIISND